jgi:pimeloyl-ACP methyl ester carboxylesterase
MNISLAQLITWYGTRRRRTILRRTPANFGLNYQDVTFRTAHEDNIQLSGWIVPASDPKGVVILCHGHGGSRRGTLKKAVMLNRYHFTTLLFDFRACGSSEGTCRTLGLNETDDVLGAVRFLQAQPLTQSLPIAVVGQSIGGAAAIRAAARCLDIRAVVAEATYAQLDAVMRRRVRLCVGPFASRVVKTCYRLGAQKLGMDLRDIAPERDIALISPRPILLIQDNLDIVCPRSESNRLYAAAMQPKERWIVPRAPHTCAYRVAPKEYERRVSEFLVRSLSLPEHNEQPAMRPRSVNYDCYPPAYL